MKLCNHKYENSIVAIEKRREVYIMRLKCYHTTDLWCAKVDRDSWGCSGGRLRHKCLWKLMCQLLGRIWFDMLARLCCRVIIIFLARNWKTGLLGLAVIEVNKLHISLDLKSDRHYARYSFMMVMSNCRWHNVAYAAEPSQKFETLPKNEKAI